MRTVSLVVAIFASFAAAIAADKGVAQSEQQGNAQFVRVLKGAVLTNDGQLLQEDDWIGANQIVTAEEDGTVLVSWVQVMVLHKDMQLVTEADLFALYCAGCACGCGDGVFHITHPDGVLDEDYCNQQKDVGCVDSTNGSLHYTSFCIAAWVPCK